MFQVEWTELMISGGCDYEMDVRFMAYGTCTYIVDSGYRGG